MKETKLRRIIWAMGVAAFALIVAMVLVWKFRFYDQVSLDLQETNKAYDDATLIANKLPKNLEEAELQRQKVALAQSQLDYFRTRFRALPFDITSEGKRNATWIRHMNEYFVGFGNAARTELIRAAEETGVTIDTKIQVAEPPQMPENVTAPPSGFLKPTEGGTSLTVTAIGTYPDLLRFFDRVNRSSILWTVGNVKLENPSPAIKATFTITPYIMTTGASALVSTPPAATAATPGANPEGGPPPGTPGAPPPTGPPTGPPAPSGT